MVNCILLGSFVLMVASSALAGTVTANSLAKQGGTSLEDVYIQKCSDGNTMVVSDREKMLAQGVSEPCQATEAGSDGNIKNIGKQFKVDLENSKCSTYIGLNAIHNGFHYMYMSSDPNNCSESELEGYKEFTHSIHKCLLLIKNELANQIKIKVSNRSVQCQSL